jgi:hypothetical protein
VRGRDIPEMEETINAQRILVRKPEEKDHIEIEMWAAVWRKKIL